MGVASGLSYLHGQTEDGKQGGLLIYHRDIKVGKSRQLSPPPAIECHSR